MQVWASEWFYYRLPVSISLAHTKSFRHNVIMFLILPVVGRLVCVCVHFPLHAISYPLSKRPWYRVYFIHVHTHPHNIYAIRRVQNTVQRKRNAAIHNVILNGICTRTVWICLLNEVLQNGNGAMQMWNVAFHRFLSFCIAVHHVTNANGISFFVLIVLQERKRYNWKRHPTNTIPHLYIYGDATKNTTQYNIILS